MSDPKDPKPLPKLRHVPPHPSSFVDAQKYDPHEHLRKALGLDEAEAEGARRHNEAVDAATGAPSEESHSPAPGDEDDGE